jgi:hypothetical protein
VSVGIVCSKKRGGGVTCYKAGFWEDCDAGDDGCVALDGLVVER